MSILSKRFWKGMAVGGISTLLIMGIINDVTSKAMKDSNNGSQNTENNLFDSLVQQLDKSSGKSGVLREVSDGNNKQTEVNAFNEKKKNNQSNGREDNEKLMKKLNLIQERMQNLSPDDES
ncbi:hypothetical protein [Selenihalanaerobacter shriftii]|uniref:Uncharacterized protein n=1 Tax=Selenihalanaerobacter shriftii TaxID=142842 RepID=A0A1T4QLW6_9FIRM|nr:hypothetical protein [Selenihalanaerobacter shriftii]SKA04637.1 hypothetical protein SAMN02745118_02608 [Selenihalanaerobacter shriftii]